MIQKEHKHVATLFGSNQKFDKNCKVLIGTSAKIGTGFDFDKLDTLLLAADVCRVLYTIYRKNNEEKMTSIQLYLIWWIIIKLYRNIILKD